LVLVALFAAPLDIWPVLWRSPAGAKPTFLRQFLLIALKLVLPAVLAIGLLTLIWGYLQVMTSIHGFFISRRWLWLAEGFAHYLLFPKEFDADRFTFDRPWMLVMLAGIPLLVVLSYRSLQALGRYRRMFALGYRARVLALMVLALAGVQLQRISERMTVIYLLDQSESVPKPVREAMIEYVMRDVDAHRRKGDLQTASEDKAGVIVFGREATIEHPPFADEIRSVGNLESLYELRTDATNIASALKLAQAAFPEDSAKRIVILTDGNENLGDARTVARILAENGVGIDVVPIKLSQRSEVAVEKVSLPADIRRGQPTETRVVLSNYGDQPVSGRLRVTQQFNNQERLLGDKELRVTLQPGKNVYSFEHVIDMPAGYTYRADFTPDEASADLMQQNNSATAFTHVRGKGRVLLIVDAEHPTEFDALVGKLGALNIEVDVMRSDNLFVSLGQLQGYDCVVLANVAKASTSGDDATNFTDEQISMLVRNTEQFGCGLVMLGGPNSFGAGGWANTELEKAMPVDFQIKNAKVKAVGALVIMFHASEIPEGNHWQKVIGNKSIEMLGPGDYCGVVHWDNFSGKDNWLWQYGGKGLVKVGDRQKVMLGKIDRMSPGDMPQFDPAMSLAVKELSPNPASVKHMIIISDGDPSPPTGTTIANYKKANVTISTVAVGAHGPAESAVLQKIATDTGGKFYKVNNPKALPKIFQRETRRVARPLIYEEPAGFVPAIPNDARAHDLVQHIEGVLPPITGFVMTTVKENPLVEVLIRSPKPGDPANSTIMASWTYGAGKTAVFTTDAGQRWANAWTEWENYDRFFSQMIRWAMRPVNEEGKFSVATDVKDGKLRIVVNALDKDDQFLNFLNMSAVGTDPEMKSLAIPIKQTAPGRYEGELSADGAGSYLLAINTGQGGAPLLTGSTVPYSAEFRERESNDALLASLVSFAPQGGQAGEVIEGQLAKGSIEQMVAQHDTFRRTLPKAVSSDDIWPSFLMLAAAIFLCDVLVRRVAIDFSWIPLGLAAVWNRYRGVDEPAPADERLERLRSRKAAVENQLEARRAATRFEPQPESADSSRSVSDVLQSAAGAGEPSPPSASPPPTSAPQTEQETYTERLLAAKKKARKD
jgi:uncharacterized membrane protein/Mg-chelatase subunit ChlD